METGTLSYELLLQYLSLCVKGGHDDEVFDVYDIMRGSFPSLETGATSLFIKSFSRTARWREALSILHDVKKVKRLLWSHSGAGGPSILYITLFYCPPNRCSLHHHATMVMSSQQQCCTVTWQLPGLFTTSWLKRHWAHTRRPGRLCLRGWGTIRRWKQKWCLSLNIRRGCWEFFCAWGTTRSTPRAASPAASRPGFRGMTKWGLGRLEPEAGCIQPYHFFECRIIHLKNLDNDKMWSF